jgi:RsiW-degrading membrane proteinase PrsW (M82 family)
MMIAAYLLGLVPTLILLVLVGAYRRRPQTLALWAAVVLGALVTIPVMFVETAVEDPAGTLPDLYQRAFVQQVLGAAVVEELALFGVFLLAYFLFRGWLITGPYDIVALAVAVAIGFTTVENLLAVLSADNALREASARLLSLVAGHATLQLIMGYFAAHAFLGRGNWALCLALMLAAPMAVHGWGDFSEAVFDAHQRMDPGSAAARNWFTAWILGLFVYVAFGAAVLWQMRFAWQDVTLRKEEVVPEVGETKGLSVE